jgi:hypothetical protein
VSMGQDDQPEDIARRSGEITAEFRGKLLYRGSGRACHRRSPKSPWLTKQNFQEK